MDSEANGKYKTFQIVITTFSDGHSIAKDSATHSAKMPEFVWYATFKNISFLKTNFQAPLITIYLGRRLGPGELWS